jgi:hypothetical protein
MQIPRFGHTLNVLPDDTILIAGGITLPAPTTDVPSPPARVVRDLEIYQPRTAVPPFDDSAQVDFDDPLVENGQFPDGYSRVPEGQAETGPRMQTVTCGTL